MHQKSILLSPVLNTLDATFRVVLLFVTFTLTELQDFLFLFTLTDFEDCTTVLTFNHVQIFGIRGLLFLSLEEPQLLEVTFFHEVKEAFEELP